MKRAFQIAFWVGLSLVFDGFICLIAYFQAATDGHVSLHWLFVTLCFAVVAVVPLVEMARRGRLIEKCLAVLFSCLPASWIYLWSYLAYNVDR